MNKPNKQLIWNIKNDIMRPANIKEPVEFFIDLQWTGDITNSVFAVICTNPQHKFCFLCDDKSTEYEFWAHLGYRADYLLSDWWDEAIEMRLDYRDEDFQIPLKNVYVNGVSWWDRYFSIASG